MHHKYILIYTQQDATLHSLFISGNCSTCFGWYWQVSDTVDTVACAPNDGWIYHPKHVEQFPDINKLCYVASCWIYSYIGICFLNNSYFHWAITEIPRNWQCSFPITIKWNTRSCFKNARNVRLPSCISRKEKRDLVLDVIIVGLQSNFRKRSF